MTESLSSSTDSARREWTIEVCVECDELVNECRCDPADWVDFSGRQCHPSSVKINVVEACNGTGKQS